MNYVNHKSSKNQFVIHLMNQNEDKLQKENESLKQRVVQLRDGIYTITTNNNNKNNNIIIASVIVMDQVGLILGNLEVSMFVHVSYISILAIIIIQRYQNNSCRVVLNGGTYRATTLILVCL